MKKTNHSFLPSMQHHAIQPARPFRQRFLAVLLTVVMLITMVDLPFTNQRATAAEVDFGANIQLSGRIIKDKDGSSQTLSSIPSGESFFLEISYQFSSAPDGISYQSPALSVQLPEYIKTDLGDSTIAGPFQTPVLEQTWSQSLGRFITTVKINCTDTIGQGASGKIYLKCSFENMVTPNLTNAEFNNVHFTGSLKRESDNATQTIDIKLAPVSIQATASQAWEVAKTVTTPAATEGTDPDKGPVLVKDEHGDYLVTYRIAVTDPAGNSNRYGRLNCDPFLLEDILPVTTREGGGATLVSAGYLDRSNTFHALALGDEGYTVQTNDDNSLKSIAFHYYNTYLAAEETGQSFVPDGAQVQTIYEFTVKYDGDAYAFPSNQPLEREILNNTATLTYKPVGEDQVVKQSAAPVQIGELEEIGTPVSLTVQKNLTINGDGKAVTDNTFVLDQKAQSVYGNATFALYFDQECTQIANTIHGEAGAGNERSIGADGTVTFSNLRHGTYYLKEVITPDGFQSIGTDGVLEVNIAQDGTVTVAGQTIQAGDSLVLTNTAKDDGMGYVALWKKGVGAGVSTVSYLRGAQFTLTKNGDNTKTYTATSDANGLVLFEAIPAGVYTLTETRTASDEYSLPATTWQVTVVGNRVNYPDGLSEDDGKPFVTNVSPYGKLSILKVDSANPDTKLKGAEFAVYGPYAADPTGTTPSGDPAFTLTTGSNGLATSGPLEPGWYLVHETKAPDNYALNTEDIAVQVVQNVTASRTVEDRLLGGLKLLKYGQLTIDGETVPEYQIDLPGAEFTVYQSDVSGNITDQVAINQATGLPAIVTTSYNSATGQQDTPVLSLNPGVYWIKETKAPEGYIEITDPIRVVIGQGATTTETISNQVDRMGQIKLTKESKLSGWSGSLAGATFEVYLADDDDLSDRKDTIVTDANGVGYSKFLPAGDYVLKETASIEGHLLPVTLVGGTITVANNKLSEITIQNDPYVSARLIKVDSVKTGTMLSGATFALYRTQADAQANQNKLDVPSVTDANGATTFSNLNPDTTYWYRELTTPEGYVSEQTIGSFTTNGVDENFAVTPVTVENDRLGVFQVKKLGKILDSSDPAATELKADAVYRYFLKTSSTSTIDQDRTLAQQNGTAYLLRTDSTGTKTSVALNPGTYWVEETEAPEGYAVDSTPQQVVVTAGAGRGAGYPEMVTVTFTNEFDSGKIQIKKVSTKDNAVLLNATFKVMRQTSPGVYEDYLVDGSVLTLRTTNGTALSGFLPAGSYQLVETAVTGLNGDDTVYEVDSTPIPFTIESGKTNTMYFDSPITNRPMVKIGVDKFERWSYLGEESVEMRHTGVTYLIFDSEEEALKDNGTPVQTLVSSDRSVWTSVLPQGDYWVKEVVPDDYHVDSVSVTQPVGGGSTKIADNLYRITLDDSGDVLMKWVNISQKSRIQLLKLDRETDNPLNGAQFSLYRTATAQDDPADIVVKTIDGVDKNLVLVQEKLESGTVFGQNGLALSTLLGPGEYYLQETRVPVSGNWKMEKEWTGPILVTESDAGRIVKSPDIYNFQPIPVEGKKIDSNGNAVAGVWVGLFETDAKAQAAAAALNENTGHFADLMVGGSFPEAVLQQYGIIQAAKSGADGKLAFEDLAPYTTYYALELVGAANYVHNTQVYPVIAKQDADAQWYLYHQDDQGSTERFVLVNEAYGRIAVSKIMNLSGTTYPLDGVTFEVYLANAAHDGPLNNTVQATLRTGTGGQGAGNALSGLLAPGWYVMREVAVPDGVDFDPDEAPYYAVYVSSVLDPQVEGTEDQSFVIENRFVTNNTYKNTPILNISAYGQVMITKVSAQNNATKVNATFKVQQQQPNGVYTDYMAGNSVMTITVDKTKDYAISSMLPVGNYQLVEIAVESGYTLDATPVRFAIQANKITGAGNLSEDVYLPLDTDAAPTPIVFTNNQKGGLELTKKGNILGVENPLSNVTFQLYAVTGSGLDPQGDCAVGKTVVGTGVTNGNGLLSITGIDAGTYWLKEASVGTNNAANGFEPGMIVQVTIQPGQTTRVYTDLQGSVHSNGILQNTTTYGKLQIVKVDEHERTLPVSGATFNVYAAGDLAQAVDQITTDPLGVAITKLLPVGDYVLKEVSAKEGYFLDTQTVWGPYAIVANQTTTTQDGTPITITNERQQTVNIIKKGSTTLTEIISPEAMSAAVFELYANKTDEEPLQTARHGALSFTELRPLTTYYIKEVVPPTGYTIEQGSDGWYQVTTGNDGTTEVTIYNDPLGAITINKVIKWQNPDEDHLVSFPFRGVTFSLYHYEEDAPDHIGSLVETNTTGDGGALTFSNLVPGQYVLQETVPDDYTADNGVTTWILTVTKGATNTELTGSNAIVNWPSKGGYRFTKFKGDGSTALAVAPGKDQATFQLYSGSTAQAGNEVGTPFMIDEDGTFETSIELLEPGTYTLKELTAPEGFTLDEQLITFTVSARTITDLDASAQTKVINDAQGNIQITKQGDAQNGNPLLNTAAFQLYDSGRNPIGNPLTNVTNGVYQWSNLDAGTYYIKEVAAPEGYELDETEYQVVIPSGQNEVKTYYPQGLTNGLLTNISTHGRIRIVKQNEHGLGLQGAEFEVYALGADGSTVGSKVGRTIVTDQNGVGLSDLLLAGADGTKYLVRETKAPDQYVLDERYHPTEMVVTVLPVQIVEKIINLPNTNQATFTDKKDTDIKMFDSQIVKAIGKDEADYSLLEEAFTTDFTLTGYANGTNELPVTSFALTDQTIEMQWQEGNQFNTEQTLEGAYRIHDITVLKAYHQLAKDNTGIDTTKPVHAQIQYQGYADLGSDRWTDLPNGAVANVQNLSAAGQTVTIPDAIDAMAIRVVYTGVYPLSDGSNSNWLSPYFRADGVKFSVTFNKRSSDATLHEITRIRNQASYAYTYVKMDQDGAEVPISVSKNSNIVTASLPLIKNIRVPVSLTVNVKNGATTYRPGDNVTYEIKAKNESTTDPFRDPVISFDLPVGMTLNDLLEGGNVKFSIKKLIDDPSGTQGNDITPSSISYDTVKATTVNAGELIKLDQDTQKVTFQFANLTLKPGEYIRIQFTGNINLNNTANSLWCPAYLGSLYTIPLSVENPYGISYTSVNTGTAGSFQQDPDLDQVLSTKSEYVNNNAEIVVGQNNTLNIFKQVKGQYDDRFKNASETGHTAPGGSIDYKIQVTNGPEGTASKTRVVDILPFMGDTLTDRGDTNTSKNRVTDLDRRPTLNPDGITVLDADGVPLDLADYIIYYATGGTDQWTAAQRDTRTAAEELPMLYESDADVWTRSGTGHSWSATAPNDMSTVTAFGVEINKTLELNGSFTILVSMTAPQYATDEVSSYYGKYISNSAMCAVVRLNGSIDLNDRTENQEVKCMLDLPKGAIGDYAWYDTNQNGLQDPGENPVTGLTVELIQTVIQDGEADQVTTRTITTDGSGWYHFDGLDCNILLADKQDGDPDDPNNYVGGKIYQYQVRFDNPSTDGSFVYAPTRQYATGDVAAENDSNIDEFGYSGIVTLGAELDNGVLVGEVNDTIDAGFVIPARLGDYVWFDANRNGIQDDDELGVNDVTVRLYTVDDEDHVSDQPLRTTKTATGEQGDGYYLFDNLTAGRYVIEFDISAIKNDYGLYAYAFTTPNQGVGSMKEQADSDAKHPVGDNDRMMRTDIITLAQQADDRSWDAGLVYYSAITGYAFDDRNYNDVQDLGYPLTGTKVSLYRVIDNVREADPIREMMVEEDGTYLFDYLIEGEYQVLFEYPDGYRAVLANQGGNDAQDSDVSEIADDQNSGFTDLIQLGPNSLEEHWDGGARLYGTIGDYVWMDANKNGLQDPGEEPIANVQVFLQRQDNNDGLWRDEGSTYTDENGRYFFTDLKSGPDTPYQYRVIFAIPQNLHLTIPNAGNNPAIDSDAVYEVVGWGTATVPINLGYGEIDLTWDAGVIQTSGSVGDYVWFDENRNGIQDEGEQGIAGIHVVLERNDTSAPELEDGWVVVGETITNSAGYYRFDDLGAGYYRVRFLIEDPYVVTLPNRGEGQYAYMFDSDGVISRGNGWYYSRPFYLEEGGYDMTWDCGVYYGSGTFIRTGDGNSWAFYTASAAVALGLAAWLWKKRPKHTK